MTSFFEVNNGGCDSSILSSDIRIGIDITRIIIGEQKIINITRI